MILQKDIAAVGRLLKPHGINGELVVMLDRDIPAWDELKCIILIMDGIPVPFFIEADRPKSAETDLITLEGIETEKEAQALCGKTVYVLKSDLARSENDDDEEGFYADDLVGFTAFSDNSEKLGKIIGLDTSTENYLFIIETESGEQLLVPAVGEFIDGIDAEKKEVTFSLPEGLLEN